MKIRTMALVMSGAVAIALAGVGAVACSSSDGSGTPSTPGSDATTGTDSSHAGNDAGTGSDTSTAADTSTGDDSSTTADGGGADCGAAGSLHPVDAGSGPYCPFSAVGDAGNLTCAFGQHCCEPGSGTATCAASCPAGDGGTDWECQGAANCATGKVCCAITTGAGQDPGCPNHFLHKFTGTTCRTTCQSGEIPVCETPGECSGGTTCQVTKAKGAVFGICQ